MNNRTVPIIITILVAFCLGCPGITALCWGMISFVDFAGGLGITGIGDQNGFLASIFGGFCSGLILISLVVLISYLLLRRKKEATSTSPDEPIPPTI